MRVSPKVSVLIPTYNSAHFLDEAIQSVLNQTYTDFELIIVDNCSTDNSEQVIAAYLSDKRVTYYKNKTNIGLVGNFNKCLEYAQGEYIKYLCSDDKFHPALLEQYVRVMDQYPNVALVTSNRAIFGFKNYIWQLPLTHLQKGKTVAYHSLNDVNWIGEPTSVMFRRANLPAVGGFRSEFTYLTDWDMWLRQLSVGDCYIIPEALSYFRVHENQTTASVMKNLSNYFEDYYFYKGIKKQNLYKLDFSEIDIDALIKRKAADCVKVILKVIPRLVKKENWQVLNKALNILYSEKVLLPSISVIFGLIKRKAFPETIKA
ncbi:MAG: glycosyltransferase family 2 protein [Adhaeribacter sp.]